MTAGAPVNTMNEHIRHLQEQLKIARTERAAYLEALRPFAREATHAEIAPRSAFERAAALVAATVPPPSVGPSAAAPETT